MDSNELIPPLWTAPPPPPPPETHGGGENPIFNLWDVLLILIVALLAQFFCIAFALVAYLGTHPSRLDSKEFASNILIGLSVQVAGYTITVAFMVFLMQQKYRANFLQAVSWNMPPARFAWGAVGVGAALAVVIQILTVFFHSWIPKSLPIDQAFRTPSSAYGVAAFGVLVAPFVEEMFFRGFLYPALARPLGVFLAAVLSAAGFAAIHGIQLAFALIPLLFLFMVGMILTLARARTKSVAVSVLMHMGYNFTLFTAVYLGTGGFRHMERG